MRAPRFLFGSLALLASTAAANYGGPADSAYGAPATDNGYGSPSTDNGYGSPSYGVPTPVPAPSTAGGKPVPSTGAPAPSSGSPAPSSGAPAPSSGAPGSGSPAPSAPAGASSAPPSSSSSSGSSAPPAKKNGSGDDDDEDDKSPSSAPPATPTKLDGGNAACGAARVRKPWDSLTEKEQSLYIEALGLAIKSGVVKDLAAMHLETMGETQAHHSCGFFVWHRRMLLAFESYLRDLDPKFACLTIPYYDVHSAYVKAANKQCQNMYDCSPIFKTLGGAPSTSDKQSGQYNGQNVYGYECKGAPFTDACDDSSKVCGAVLRDNLEKKPVPSGAGFGSFLDVVTRSKDYAAFLENIQFGIHNEIHNAVGGVMSTFASPRDIFFYSWHAAIDMYLSVYTQCQITGVAPGAKMSDDEMKNSLLAITQASQTCGGVSGVGAMSPVVMNMMVDGKLVDASQHPKLGKYFSHVGDAMWQYGDTQRLGDYSYSYELPSIIKTQVLSNEDVCKGVKSSSTPAPSSAAPSSGANTNATETMAPHTGIVVSNSTGGAYGSGDDDSESDSDDSKADGKKNSVSGGAYGSSETVATSGSYWEWIKVTYEGLMERFERNVTIVSQQMRVIECMAFDNTFGVTEFSDEFVKNFHLASKQPVCGKKLDAVESGEITVAVEEGVKEFKAEKVTFAKEEVIVKVKEEAKKAPVTEMPMLDKNYIAKAEETIQKMPKTAAPVPATPAAPGAPAVPATPAYGATTTTSDRKAKHKLCH